MHQVEKGAWSPQLTLTMLAGLFILQIQLTFNASCNVKADSHWKDFRHRQYYNSFNTNKKNNYYLLIHHSM